MNHLCLILLIAPYTLLAGDTAHAQQAPVDTYAIVDTGVDRYFDTTSVIQAPSAGEAFYGQDAHYQGAVPSYTDNGDGTVSDTVTGLMWQQDMGVKMTFDDAAAVADTLTSGGYDDWRVPTIKELYSLILFTGSNGNATDEETYVRYIDTDYFNQPFGDQNAGERIIDAQTWSATEYVGVTMNNDQTVFGVNFVDGRIKGYPKYKPGTNDVPNAMYFRLVRGNTDYGDNAFAASDDGTVTDSATGLMWQRADDGGARDWEEALAYAENLELAGFDDWRLPNAKELQSIVDYSRSPQTTGSPAIDPVFSATEITDPEGNSGQYPYYWTGTTHVDGIDNYRAAVYVAFGEAQGQMHDQLMDVHGAGAQRSDPKTGSPADYPTYWGPQGDVRYVFNYVRCVRDAGTILSKVNSDDNPVVMDITGNYPNPFNPSTTIEFTLPEAGYTELALYTISGQKIRELFSEVMAPGVHSVVWDGNDQRGTSVSSGVIISRLQTGDTVVSKRMMLVK